MTHSRTLNPSHDASGPVSARMAQLLEQLRSTRPLVQCLTNTVVSNFTANALLALGAAPAMTDIQGEAGPFAEIADGMLINLGTPDPEQRGAMREAAAARQAGGRPWVLDPVAIGSLPIRTALAAELLESRPAVIRGNPSEVLALTGGAGGRGVDTTDAPEAAVQAARQLVSTGCADAVAISGPVDLIVSASGTLRVPHGHELLTHVVGGGCALGSVIAAFAAVAQDPADAAAAGSLVWGLAAEDAADRCQGPGSFAVHLLDALAGLRPEDVAERCRVEAEAAGAPSAADGAAAGAGQAEEAGR